MTTPDDDRLDGELIELFQQLKRIELPPETSESNRLAVQRALSGVSSSIVTPVIPWWKRSIAVPIPAAVGMVLALIGLGVGLGSVIRDGTTTPSVVENTDAQPIERRDNRPDSRARIQYYEVNRYLCGVGQIASTRGYRIVED